MPLESGRDLFRDTLILLAAAIAYRLNLTAGLGLVVFVGVMILQSWRPAGARQT